MRVRRQQSLLSSLPVVCGIYNGAEEKAVFDSARWLVDVREILELREKSNKIVAQSGSISSELRWLKSVLAIVELERVGGGLKRP
ncbi:hypothetical protein BHE74_00007456 [Ensete ventricosum]|nr:hypothetical protein GW17_00024265 [Ensete ventricosum]RWW83985.1 hypothetical protein BHE74_00007456 [Ensete ventricosum]